MIRSKKGLVFLAAVMGLTVACGGAERDEERLGGGAPVQVNPATATIARGTRLQLTATAPAGVTWSVQEGAAGGGVGATGLYTAPSATGTYHVVATSRADPAQKAAATVTVGVGVPAPSGGDDTAAFQAAVTSGGGKTVVIAGSGTYSLRAVQVTAPGTTIACTGSPAATLALRPLAAGDGSPILDVKAGGFTLLGCTLDGNRAAQPPGGFNDSFTGRAFRAALRMDVIATGLTVDRATFQDVYGAAIATRMVSGVRITNSRFQDLNFEAAFAVSTFTSGDPVNDVVGFTFTGNTATRLASGDASVNANGLVIQQYRSVNVSANSWDGFERNAMKLENCRDGVIAGNRIRNGALPSFAGIGLQNGVHSVTVSDNTVDHTGSGIDTSLVADGQFGPDTVDHLTIRDNVITNVQPGAMPDGIRVLGYGSALTDLAITGNVVQAVPRYGVNVRQFTVYAAAPTFARVTIQDNHLTGAGGCTSWFAGSAVTPTGAVTTPNTCD